MTKQEILKLTGLTEVEFYKKFPSKESFTKAYPEYQLGGILPSIKQNMRRFEQGGPLEGDPVQGKHSSIQLQQEPQQPNFDEMSFKEAFATARQEGIKTFRWRGKLYGTKLTSENAPQSQGYFEENPNRYALGGFMNPASLNQDVMSVGGNETAVRNEYQRNMAGAIFSTIASFIPFIGQMIPKTDNSFMDAAGQSGAAAKSALNTANTVGGITTKLGELTTSAITGLKAGGTAGTAATDSVKEGIKSAAGSINFNTPEKRFGGIMRKGGMLSDVNFGSKHEQGGVKLSPDAEVEEGESIAKGFVFSDALVNPQTNKTFAQDSKRINKKFTADDLRTEDPITKKALEVELGRLAKTQEDFKQEQELMQQTELFDLGGVLDPKPKFGKIYKSHKQMLQGPNWKDSMLNYLENKASSMGKKYQPTDGYGLIDDYFYFMGEDFSNKKRYQKLLNQDKFSMLKGLTGSELGKKAQLEQDVLNRKSYEEAQNVGSEMNRRAIEIQRLQQEGLLEFVNPVDEIYKIMRSNGQAIPQQKHPNQFSIGGTINPRFIAILEDLDKRGIFKNPEVFKSTVSPQLRTQRDISPEVMEGVSKQNMSKFSYQPNLEQKNTIKEQDFEYPGINPLGYATGAASILGKAILNAAQKGPAMGRPVALKRFNINPQLRALEKAYNEQLASQMYATKENAPTTGSYLSNVSLGLGKGFSDKGVQTAGLIGAGMEKNVGISAEEEVKNQAIQYQNDVAQEQFRDKQMQGWDTTLNSVNTLGQTLGKDLGANKAQNFMLKNLLKTGNLKWGPNGILVKTTDDKGNIQWKPYNGVDQMSLQNLLFNYDPYASAQDNNMMLKFIQAMSKGQGKTS